MISIAGAFNDNTKMLRCLVFLAVCILTCTARGIPCSRDSSVVYEGVVMQCSGTKVTYVPIFLPNNLQKFRLTDTAIETLDENTFHGREFPELKALYVTGGQLTSVGADAFCSLPQLTMLYLTHNQLVTLSESSFRCNQVLRIVNLMNNPTLHHLPRLVSPSVERLYLDNCNLENVDVADVEGLTALGVLSLTGNRRLHCPSIKQQFAADRPDVLVECEDPVEDLPSSVSPGDQEHKSEQSPMEPEPAVRNEENDATVEEERTSGKPLDYSDSTTRSNERNITENAQTFIPLPIVIGIGIAIAISIVCIFTVISVFLMRRYCSNVRSPYFQVRPSDENGGT